MRILTTFAFLLTLLMLAPDAAAQRGEVKARTSPTAEREGEDRADRRKAKETTRRADDRREGTARKPAEQAAEPVRDRRAQETTRSTADRRADRRQQRTQETTRSADDRRDARMGDRHDRRNRSAWQRSEVAERLYDHALRHNRTGRFVVTDDMLVRAIGRENAERARDFGRQRGLTGQLTGEWLNDRMVVFALGGKRFLQLSDRDGDRRVEAKLIGRARSGHARPATGARRQGDFHR